jgi:hypothetical protein
MMLRSLATAILAVGIVSPAAAQVALVTPVPSVHLAVAGVTSCAQLIQRLQSQGYTDIKMTEDYPNILDPRPEIRHGYSTAEDPEAQDAPAHYGWMGTAVKDGQTANIYVDTSPARSASTR